MACLHLIDVPALLDGVQELRDQLGQGEAELAHQGLAGAIGRWIEADPNHPVVVLVADAPLTAPPVAGLIGKHVPAVEPELLRRLAHGQGGRYRVVSRSDAVTAAAKQAECALVEPAELWDQIKTVVDDPFGLAPAAEPGKDEAPAAKKKAAKKKAAKKKAAKKKVAKKTAAKKTAAKKTAAKKTAAKKTATKKTAAKKTATKKTGSKSTEPASDADPEGDPAREHADLNKLVDRALGVSPPSAPEPRRPAQPPRLRTDGELNADQVAAWEREFAGRPDPANAPAPQATPAPPTAQTPAPPARAESTEADEVNEWLSYFERGDS